MSSFSGEPKRSDLRLILQALRNGWPVESNKLTEVEGFVIQARLTGRTDRLTSLAAEVLQEIHDHRAKLALSADQPQLESMLQTERQRDENLVNSGDYPRFLPTNDAGPVTESQ